MANAKVANTTSWKFEASFSLTYSETTSTSTSPPSVNLSSSTSTAGHASQPERKPSPPTSRPAAQSSSNNVGFSFVNVAHPNDARGSSNKRAIRSHVAKVQHSKTRASKSAVKDATKARAQNRTLHPRIKAEPDSIAAEPVCKQEPSPISTDEPDDVEEVVRHDSQVGTPQDSDVFRLVRLLRGGRHDPFWTYPIPHHRDIEKVLDHYVVNILVDVPWVVPEDQPGLLVKKWMPLCMSEPAIFYAVALMGAAHQAMVNPKGASALDILSLKGKTITAINEALSDPVRSQSDAMIGAVMKMAAYESIFGDENFFNAHMAGLQQMVRMRGGLPNLGLDGLMERVVLWIDSNASHHLGCGWKFDKKWFPTVVRHPVPDVLRTQPGAEFDTARYDYDLSAILASRRSSATSPEEQIASTP